MARKLSMRRISHFGGEMRVGRHLEQRLTARQLLRATTTARFRRSMASVEASNSTAPASVSRTVRLVRTNSATPSWSSNSLI